MGSGPKKKDFLHDFCKFFFEEILRTLLSLCFQKKQTKWSIELWILKQEMETDGDHVAMRESFSLVQNILFIEHTDEFPAHL